MSVRLNRLVLMSIIMDIPFDGDEIINELVLSPRKFDIVL